MYYRPNRLNLLISFRSATFLRVWPYIPCLSVRSAQLAGYVGLSAEKTNAAAAGYEFHA